MDAHPEGIARIVELGEGEAYADLFAAAPGGFAARYGMRVAHIGSAIALVAQGIGAVLFNRVMGLGLVKPATAAMVDDVIKLYRDADVQNYAVQVSPAAQSPALTDWLQVRGLRRNDNWAKVYRDAESPSTVPSELRVEPIGQQHAAAFAKIACDVFGMPPFMSEWLEALVGRLDWTCYCAFDADRPVATGALYVRGEVGWLGMAATLPSHRGRGAQSAILARRIHDGIAQGCRWLVTETAEDVPDHPNPSYHNMLRTGFKLAYQRPNYMPARA